MHNRRTPRQRHAKLPTKSKTNRAFVSLPPLRSLKRKRGEDEDAEGESKGESEQGDSPLPATEPRKRGRPRKERKSLFLLSLFHFLTVLFVLEPRQLPSRQVRDKKRLRKSCFLFIFIILDR